MRTASSIDRAPEPPGTFTRTSLPSRDALPTGASTSTARAVESSSRIGDLDHRGVESVLQLRGGALGDHGAVVDDHDVVGEHVGFLEVLRGEQDGGAATHERLDHAPELVAALGVESGGGLVEEEHGRAVHERGGEVEATAHAAGVRARHAVGGVAERELLEQLVGAGGDLRRRQVRQLAHQREVLATGEVLVDRGVLAGEADAPSHPLRVLAHVDAEHAGGSPVGLEQGGEHPHGRGLARAVGPEQAEDLAFGHLERDPFHRLDIAEALHQFVGHDRRSCHERHTSQDSLSWIKF